ncbi:MAG: histidine kinase [Cyclobacteriaceae bacterium]|nr:histidine kinase [Cyclobacteriaceae bacterium]
MNKKINSKSNLWDAIGINKYVLLGLLLVGSVSRIIYAHFFMEDATFLEKVVSPIISPLAILLYFAIIIWLDRRLEKVFPYDRYKIKRVVIQTMLSCLFLLPVLLLAIWYVIEYSNYEFNHLTISAAISGNIIFIAAINIALYGNYFFKNWQKTLLEAQQLAREKSDVEKNWAQMQYHNLINQLNPHFFFNSIASLDNLIKENPVLASEFLQQLSRVYRYILLNRDKDLVSIETELEFAENYFSLLKTRFGSAIEVVIEVDEDSMDLRVVPVTLQALVENAIKHNRMTKNEPLKIVIQTDENFLTVWNNKQMKKQVETSNKKGLANLRTLYSYLSPKELQIENQWDHFSVKVPLIP